MDEASVLRFKVIFLGDAGVGKTSIIRRQTLGTFDFKMAPTIGTGNLLSEVEVDKRIVQLCIWDTAGQENYKSITRAYFHGALGAIIVFDITQSSSFDSVSKTIYYDPTAFQ